MLRVSVVSVIVCFLGQIRMYSVLSGLAESLFADRMAYMDVSGLNPPIERR